LTEERLAVCILRVNGLNTNHSAIKVVRRIGKIRVEKSIGTVKCAAACGAIKF